MYKKKTVCVRQVRAPRRLQLGTAINFIVATNTIRYLVYIIAAGRISAAVELYNVFYRIEKNI